MLKKKVVFLDKDGTIIPDIPYDVNPALITLANGVIEGLNLLKQKGYIFIVISNQAGVARGYFEIEALELVEQKLNDLFNKEGLEIAGYYFCPHHPEGKVPEFSIACNCRKPKPGMILKAIDELQVDAESSWMVGDILNDVEAGNRAGCRTVLLDNGNETEWVEAPFRTPTFAATTFLEAAKFISDNTIEPKRLNDTKLEAV
jgi:D-glycero-D-manno-heptose 1,7-bisphosphate phosphatase